MKLLVNNPNPNVLNDPIDWTQNGQLLMDDNEELVLLISDNGIDENHFEGVSLNAPSLPQVAYSKEYEKALYKVCAPSAYITLNMENE